MGPMRQVDLFVRSSETYDRSRKGAACTPVDDYASRVYWPDSNEAFQSTLPDAERSGRARERVVWVNEPCDCSLKTSSTKGANCVQEETSCMICCKSKVAEWFWVVISEPSSNVATGFQIKVCLRFMPLRI